MSQAGPQAWVVLRVGLMTSYVTRYEEYGRVCEGKMRVRMEGGARWGVGDRSGAPSSVCEQLKESVRCVKV